jgi:hypothetical protein
VNFRCGVCCQDVSCGQRGAVVGRSTLCEDWRAVRHELCQSLGYRVGARGVYDRGGVAGNVGSRRLCRFTAVLARGHCDDAGREGSRGVSTAGDSHRAGSDRGVRCGSLGVVLWWLRLTAGRPATTWVRSTSGMDVSLSVVTRWLAVRRGGMSWRLAVRLRGMNRGLAVSSSRIDRWLAPARIYNG